MIWNSNTYLIIAGIQNSSGSFLIPLKSRSRKILAAGTTITYINNKYVDKDQLLVLGPTNAVLRIMVRIKVSSMRSCIHKNCSSQIKSNSISSRSKMRNSFLFAFISLFLLRLFRFSFSYFESSNFNKLRNGGKNRLSHLKSRVHIHQLKRQFIWGFLKSIKLDITLSDLEMSCA